MATEKLKWNYDLIVENIQEAIHDLHKQRASSRKLRKKAIKVLGEAPPVNTPLELTHLLEDLLMVRDGLVQSKPFLLGGATLDSLLNQDPETYDYVKNAQIPFPNMFFDLVSAPKIRIPFIDKTVKPMGIHFLDNSLTIDEEGQLDESFSRVRYSMRVYYENNLLSASPSEFFDSFKLIGGLQDSKSIIVSFGDQAYGIDTVNKTVLKTSLGSAEEIMRTADPDFEYTEKDADDAMKFANLSINFVNYINAFNTTISTRRRKVEQKIGGKLRRTEEEYGVIVLKDRVVDDYESKPTLRKLEWRVYVRGHNRHYRDEQGLIESVTWIEPHIRGPGGAPWRHNRYADLAAKLEQERELRKQGVL